MTKLVNDLVERMTRNLTEAGKLEGKGSALRFCAAQDMRDALDTGRITNNGKPFKPVAAWCDKPKDNDNLAARVAIKHELKISGTHKTERLAAFRGNAAKVDAITAEFRNANANVDRTFGTMLAMAYLEAQTGAQAMLDPVKGSAALPAAWFVPFGACSERDHEVMGDASPWRLMLAPTSTQQTATLRYLAPGGLAEYNAAVKAWEALPNGKGKGAKPDPMTFCAVIGGDGRGAGDGVSVSPTGLMRAAQERMEAMAAAANPPQQQTGNGSSSNGTAQPPQQQPQPNASATTQQPPQDATQQPQTGNAAETQQRAPQQAGNDAPAVTLSQAMAALRSLALRDDSKAKLSQAMAEEFAAMAYALWTNPHCTAILLAEREKLAKERDAQKRDAQPGQQRKAS